MTHITRAHPRACGENIAVRSDCIRLRGSSPRMRGKLEALPTIITTVGLIPAHAGKTRQHGPRKSAHRAHPRACGENSVVDADAAIPEGSSPRMRGKRGMTFDSDCAHGLIPAHAGKTNQVLIESAHAGAHPRACGENVQAQGGVVDRVGSSPRMRGKLLPPLLLALPVGLIPAHAGKTQGRSERR